MITSGPLETAKPSGAPVFSAPFSSLGVNTVFVLRQPWMQFLVNFAPLALDTPHPVYADFLLVEESPLEDSGVAGVVKWSRIYAKKPEDFSRPAGNYSYNFIGFFGSFGSAVTQATGRNRFTRNVPARLQRDFFLIGASPSADFLTFEEIPQISQQRYYYGSDPTLDLDFLADSPPFQQATTPSATAYKAMITAEDEIVAEASKLEVWMGNIYIRETIYVKAQ